MASDANPLSTPLTLNADDSATFAGNIVLGDDDQIQLGAESGGDMHIRHSGSHGYISNTTGDLFITDTNGDIYIQAKSNENSIACWNDEGVYLYYNALKKFETTSAGATVTGTLTATLSGTATGLAGTPNISVGNITTTGYLRGPASFTIDPATHGDDTGTVVIAGNLQVDGTTTTINSTTVAIDDLNFSIATDAADSAAANGAGITIGGASATLIYTHATTSWDMNKPLNVTGNIGVSGTVDGVDIAARDAVLTSTTTTANAALPKAGGTMTGHVLFNDGIELRLGADTDMGLFASSGTSNIRVNEGIFALRANDLRLMNQANDESYIRAVDDGAVSIYYDNAVKLC
jgi:hypothetical protein